PVVMTFDDSTKEQFAYGPDGKIKPDTALGIMLAFQRKHPDFKLAGTFYPNREPFAGVKQGPAMLRWLVAHGFELGDHTYDHVPLNTLGASAVQKELVRGAGVIEQAVPGYRIVTVALPLGALPKPPPLARHGRRGRNGRAWHRASGRARGCTKPLRGRRDRRVDRGAQALDVGAERVRPLLGDLDRARADDDAVGELGGRTRVLRGRDPEAGVEG